VYSAYILICEAGDTSGDGGLQMNFIIRNIDEIQLAAMIVTVIASAALLIQFL
jgi:hypothetical protein